MGLGARLGTSIVATATISLSGAWASSAGAATQTIGQIAPTPGSGGTCTACTLFQAATDAGSPSYAVPAGSWTITAWSALAGTSGGQARLRVFRAGPGAGEYTVFAESAEQTIPPSTSGPFGTSIPVQPGDVIGIRSGSSPGNMTTGYITSAPGDAALEVNGDPPLAATVCGSGSAFTCNALTPLRTNIAATLVGEPPAPGGGAETPDRAPPKLFAHSRHKTHRLRPIFRFSSNEPGVTFLCRVGKRPFQPCSSPWRAPNLGEGVHIFVVRARDLAGNVSTAKRTYRVLPRSPVGD
jgi:hypothetical protein